MKRFIFRNILLFDAVKNRITSRFTTAGLFGMYLLMISAVFGLDTKQTLSYQIFSFLFFMLALALAWGMRLRGRFSIGRNLPPFATVDESLFYRVAIKNETNQKQAGLFLAEYFEKELPTYEEFIRMREPGESSRNFYDRWAGYHRWVYLCERKEAVRSAEQPLPVLPAKGRIEVRVEIMPKKRGYLHMRGFKLFRCDPLGMVKASRVLACPQSLVVLPRRYRIPPVPLPGKRRHQPGGVALASSIGESEECISLRDYRPGDPLRRIHWKSWAKKDKPVVKEFQDEFFVRHALILDTFQQEPWSEVFEEAVSVAASYACTVQTQESLLDLMFVGTEAFCFTIGRGLAHTEKMLEILAAVTPCRDKPFSALSPLVSERYSLLSGCICIFLAWDEERKALVALLKRLNIPLLVLVVQERDHREAVDFGPLREQPENLRFLDIHHLRESQTVC